MIKLGIYVHKSPAAVIAVFGAIESRSCLCASRRQRAGEKVSVHRGIVRLKCS